MIKRINSLFHGEYSSEEKRQIIGKQGVLNINERPTKYAGKMVKKREEA